MISNLKMNETCILCGGPNITVDGQPQISPLAQKYIRHEYRIVKCADCHFYFVIPAINLSASEWGELYGNSYFGEMPAWWAQKREKHRKLRLDRLERFSKIPISDFLDVGCGEGYVLIDALRRGWKPRGIDISDNRVEAAQNFAFTKGDIWQAGFAENSFDCIYFDSVLEHLLNPLAYLRELNRILKPGGVLYIGVPNEDCLFNDAKKVIFILTGKAAVSVRALPFKSPYHVVGFALRSLRIAIDKCSFEILQLNDFAGLFEWRKFRPFTWPFIMHLMMLPVQMAAIPLRKRIYIDAVVRKK